MQSTNVLDYMALKIKEQRESVVNSLTTGRLPYEEYRRLCGVLEGLEYADSVIKHTAHKMENADE